ncbi:hypothetical protein BKA70DRAFT_1574363 [Coprinopsis sp. MPI-PUGE-AT-0042]|nr:hypothetical protein BKA70DRAFT_1574363 [Coprinopsis sp. MPI-PUGE-AT-0042]
MSLAALALFSSLAVAAPMPGGDASLRDNREYTICVNDCHKVAVTEIMLDKCVAKCKAKYSNGKDKKAASVVGSGRRRGGSVNRRSLEGHTFLEVRAGNHAKCVKACRGNKRCLEQCGIQG